MPTQDVHDPLDAAAESFLARLRRGETPSISEYAARYPELADEIRDLFPTLAIVERLGERAADESSATILDEPPMPRRLGNYEIVGEIGRGGMGVVYEAYHKPLGRRVALKVLRGDAGRDTKRLLRFRREARAAARLHHTNIVPVHEVGLQDGVNYYSMQFIEGQSLDKVWSELRRGPSDSASATVSLGQKSNQDPRRLAEELLTGTFFAGGIAVHSSAVATQVSRGAARGAAEGPIKSTCPRDNESERFVDPRQSERGTDSPIVPRHTDDTNSNVKALIDTTTGSPDCRYYQNIARVALQVVDALSYAHGEGVLHRDVKPSNVILDAHGRAWVTDFGLAKTDDDQLTETGDVIGTLRYMSPERFTEHADERSDIYSAALTLYEFLTLQPAFYATQRTSLLQQIQHADPPRPRKIRPSVPRDLETIVIKATDREPSRRYQTAEELAEDLRRFVTDRPIVARRTSVIEHAWRWCRRNPAVASLGASVMGLMAALVLVVVLGLARFAVTMRDHADSLAIEKRNVETAERDGRHRLFQAYYNEARAGRWSRRQGQRLDSLAALHAAAQLLPSLGLAPEVQQAQRLALRNEAIACLALTDLRKTSATARTPPDVRALAYDATLARYAWGDKDGKITICRASDKEQLAELPGFGNRVWTIQFSPDGQFLAARHQQSPEFCVWDLSRQRVTLKAPMVLGGNAVDFSPNSRSVAIGQEDQAINVYDLESGQLMRRLEVGLMPFYMRFDRQGNRLAISSTSGLVRLWDLQADRQLTSLTHPVRVFGMDWSLDGKLLAAGCGDFRVYVWNLEAEKEQAVCVGHEAEAVRVCFSGSGNILASSGWDYSTRLWDPWDGRQLVSGYGTIGRFSADDARLAFAVENLTSGNDLGCWEVTGNREFRTLREPPAPGKGPHNLDIHPGGRLMVSTGDDGVRLWDLALGKEIALLVGTVGTSTPHAAARFDPSGHSLITSGAVGLNRWPVMVESQPDVLKVRIGPPERLASFTPGEIALTDDILAFVHDDAAHLLREEKSDAPTNLTIDATTIRLVALSPDGKWLATGGGRGIARGVRVWNARTGELIDDLYPQAYNATVAFSPNGKWLVAGSSDIYSIWEVGSWRLVHEIPRANEETGPGGSFVAFTRDGRLLAVPHSRRVIRLVDPDTGRHLATLEAPNLLGASRLCFSPDGTRLAAACGAAHAIQVWNLRLIRRQLRQIGLDWESPGAERNDRDRAPVASPDRDTLSPIVVVVDRGEVSD